jgi:isoquinoline 1-oxidoreductase alpha subunit
LTDLTVDGQPIRCRLSPETPLLFALRDASNLTGAQYGCGTGECGACTVHGDGKAVRSCPVPIAHVEGTFVTTIEALSRDRGHPVQQAMAAEGAIQCGFCTPGIVMTAAALLAASPRPGGADTGAAITHLCRCGVQPRLAAPSSGRQGPRGAKRRSWPRPRPRSIPPTPRVPSRR